MLPLTASQPPDWRPLVDAYLAPFQRRGVQRRSVDCAEEWAGNATQYEVAGSWRAKVWPILLIPSLSTVLVTIPLALVPLGRVRGYRPLFPIGDQWQRLCQDRTPVRPLA